MRCQGASVPIWALVALFCLAAEGVDAAGLDAPLAPVFGSDSTAATTSAAPAPALSMTVPMGAPAANPSTQMMSLQGGYLEFDRAKRIAVLKEDAHIEYEDLKLWADNIHDDLNHDQVYAQGKIELWRGKERYRGDTLAYNYKTRRGSLGHLNTIHGVDRIRADRTELEPDRIIGFDVSTTTCDHVPPHYRILAKKMTLLPGDRMILEHVVFKVHEHTWFRLPRYVVTLKNGADTDRFFFKPGYTAVRGFMLKSAYQFYATDHFFGKVYYNPSQFEGTDLGGHFHYKLDPRELGELDYSQQQSYLIQQKAERLQIDHRANLPWAQANLNLLMTDTTFGTTGEDKEMNVDAKLRRTFPGWNAEMEFQRRFDLLGDSVLFNQVQFLNTTPKLTVTQTGTHQLGGTGIGVNMDANVGQYREDTAMSAQSASRAEANFNVSLPPARLGDAETLNASIRQSEDFYSTGAARHFFSFQANSFEKYGDALNSSFQYVFQDTMGDSSPFAAFDTLPPKSNLLTGFLKAGNYDHFNATLLQISHDFVTGRYQNASSNFVYHTPIGGRRFLSLGLTPFWDLSRDPTDLDSLRLGSVSTNFRINSGTKWSHAIITNYDAIEHRVQSIANRSGFLLNAKTRLDLDSNLSRNTLGTGYDLTKLNLGITRDFHDFEGALRWNTIQQEVFVEFYLKYASTKRIGLGTNYGDNPQLVPTFGPTGSSPLLQ